MARIKINSNPNKNPAPGKRNPTEQAEGEYDYYWNVVAEKYGHKDREKKPIKVSSNPASGAPGKTQISSMANVRGRIVGGGLGGMFGTKNR